MIHAVVITHGPIGEALIEATQTILGKTEGLYGITVTGMSLTEIQDRLLSLVQSPEEKSAGVIIMVCLKGGSCWNVAAGIALNEDNVRLISGVNLPMLLSFMTKRENSTLDELLNEIEKDGIRGIIKFDRIEKN